MKLDRRSFLRALGGTASAVVLAPLTTSCSSDGAAECATPATSGAEAAADPLAIPRERPADWDPIAFNRARGNAGAIPESYLPQINGPDGEMQHLGKHLPYVPTGEHGAVPAGMIAIMWGDPGRGHAKHPNAVRNESNQMQGHWYDWIEIRKAVESSAQSERSTYPEWPSAAPGQFLVLGGGELTEDSGKNTIYLAKLPDDVRPGDLVRIHARCLTHGEYVDFLTVPG